MNICSDKVKIMYIVTKGDVGGAQKYVSQLVNGIDKSRFEPLVVSGSFGGSLEVYKKLRWLSNDYRPWLFFYNDILALFELWFFLIKEKPSVVHLNSSKAGVIGALAGKLARVNKVVFTAHGWVFSDMDLSYQKRLFFIWLHKVAALFCDVIINVSRFDREIGLRNKIASSKKMVVIENGIDINEFLKNLLDKEEARKVILNRLEKNVLDDKLWIGSIGRLVKEKNYSLLINTAVSVDAYFFIIGKGYEFDLLNKLIKEKKLEDKFFIVNPEGGDAKLLKAFDVFVLTSRKEGMPYTLIEAMASSVPVVVSDVGGMPEIVKTRGFVFEKGSRESLEEDIEKAINFKDTDKALDFCKSNLDLSRLINKVEGIYLS